MTLNKKVIFNKIKYSEPKRDSPDLKCYTWTACYPNENVKEKRGGEERWP